MIRPVTKGVARGQVHPISPKMGGTTMNLHSPF